MTISQKYESKRHFWYKLYAKLETKNKPYLYNKSTLMRSQWWKMNKKGENKRHWGCDEGRFILWRLDMKKRVYKKCIFPLKFLRPNDLVWALTNYCFVSLKDHTVPSFLIQTKSCFSISNIPEAFKGYSNQKTCLFIYKVFFMHLMIRFTLSYLNL